MERGIDPDLAPAGVHHQWTGRGCSDECQPLDEAATSRPRTIGYWIDPTSDQSLQPRSVQWVGGAEACGSQSTEERFCCGHQGTAQLIIGVAGGRAMTREPLTGHRDGDHRVVGDRRGRSEVDELAVRVRSDLVPLAAFIALEPLDVVLHPGWTSDVGPREVRDNPTFNSELPQQVTPTGQKTLLLTPWLHDELRPRHGNDGCQGAPAPVADGADAGASSPVDIDEVDSLETRGHRGRTVAVGPERQRCVPSPPPPKQSAPPADEQR